MAALPASAGQTALIAETVRKLSNAFILAQSCAKEKFPGAGNKSFVQNFCFKDRENVPRLRAFVVPRDDLTDIEHKRLAFAGAACGEEIDGGERVRFVFEA